MVNASELLEALVIAIRDGKPKYDLRRIVQAYPRVVNQVNPFIQWERLVKKITFENDHLLDRVDDLGNTVTYLNQRLNALGEKEISSTDLPPYVVLRFVTTFNPISLDGADYVLVKEGPVFEFRGQDGTLHATFQKDHKTMPTPNGAVGAIKRGKTWFWVIDSKAKQPPTPDGSPQEPGQAP